MRRARQQLRPNTFPFMAVLLCAMGSLILLLLVLDRRAKLVARAKTLEAVCSAEERQALEKSKTAEREAEWRRRQDELHAYLLAQDQQIIGELGKVQATKGDVDQKIAAGLGQQAKLLQILQSEQARLEKMKGELQQRQTSLSQAQAKTGKARQELAQLAGELAQLELALTNLQKLRAQQQQCFSVIPYKGNRGDNRTPHYVECVAAGVVFHPDRRELAGPDFTPLAIRNELERRIRERENKLPAADKGKRPYLFVLVRPDGMNSYYSLHTALAGLKVDLGYELIDRDWVLDFGGDGAVKPGPDAVAMAVPPPTPAGSGKAVQGYHAGSAGHANPPWPGAPPLPGAGGTATEPPIPPGLPVGGPPGVAGYPSLAGNKAGNSGVGVGSISAGGVGPASGDGPPIPGGKATSGGPFPPGGPLAAGAGGSGNKDPNASPGGTGFAPGGTPVALAAPFPIGGGPPGGGAWSPGGGGNTGGGGPPNAGSAAPGNGTNGGGLSFTPGGGATGDGPSGPGSGANSGPPAAAQGGGAAGKSGAGAPDGIPSPGGAASSGNNSGVAGSQPGSVPGNGASPGPAAPGGAPGNGAGGQPGHGPAGTGVPDDGSGEPGLPSFINPALMPPKKGTPKQPVAYGKNLGNRDWNITLTCSPKGVALALTQQDFALTLLQSTTPGESPLRKAVRELIDKKQATVRPGDPPFRPILYFEVPPDGLRTYWAAAAVRHNINPYEPTLQDYFRK